jgi:hypothetical protein
VHIFVSRTTSHEVGFVLSFCLSSAATLLSEFSSIGVRLAMTHLKSLEHDSIPAYAFEPLLNWKDF